MADELAKKLSRWAKKNREYLGIMDYDKGLPYIDTEHPLTIDKSISRVNPRADLYIHTQTGKAHIFVEIERSSGTGTVSNVAKYWLWNELYLDRHKRDKIYIIQVRSPQFFKATENNYKSSIAIADFIAKKMKKEHGSRFQFKPIADFTNKERWEQEAFNRCKEEITLICLKKRAS